MQLCFMPCKSDLSVLISQQQHFIEFHLIWAISVPLEVRLYIDPVAHGSMYAVKVQENQF